MKKRPAKRKRVVKDPKKALTSKINARLRAWYKSGISRDLVVSEIIDNIEGVTDTDKGYIRIEGELNDMLKQTLESTIGTLTSKIKNIEDEAYNVHSIAPTRQELIGAYNSRLFMTSHMGSSFKNYYNIMDALSEETIKVDKSLRTKSGKTLDQAMQEIGRLLHDAEETKAKEKIAEIKEVIERAKERVR